MNKSVIHTKRIEKLKIEKNIYKTKKLQIKNNNNGDIVTFNNLF